MVTKGFYTFVKYANHDVWCFGSNNNYELGLGHSNPVPAPVKHDMLSQLHIKDIFPWCYGCYAITYNDQMYVWGLQAYLEGVSQSTTTTVPVLCDVLCNKNITNVYSYIQTMFFSHITNSSYCFSADTSNRTSKPYPLHHVGISNIALAGIGEFGACLVIGPIPSQMTLFKQHRHQLCDVKFVL